MKRAVDLGEVDGPERIAWRDALKDTEKQRVSDLDGREERLRARLAEIQAEKRSIMKRAIARVRRFFDSVQREQGERTK